MFQRYPDLPILTKEAELPFQLLHLLPKDPEADLLHPQKQVVKRKKLHQLQVQEAKVPLQLLHQLPKDPEADLLLLKKQVVKRKKLHYKLLHQL